MRTLGIALSIVLAVGLGLFAGARYESSKSQAQIEWLQKRLAVAQSQRSDMGWIRQLDSMNEEWWAQMREMSSPPEPTRTVKRGVYLCRLRASESSAPIIVVDFEATTNPVARITNDSDFTQALRLHRLASVYALDESKNPLEGPPLLYEVPQDAFFRELASDSATGTALREAHWWVTVYDTDQALQLTQAPTK